MNTTIEADVLRALRRLIRAADLGAKALARQTGLTTSQLLILETLSSSDTALTVGTIAERVGLAQGTATTMLDRLERRGLAKRRRADSDRRQVKVTLTEQGQQLLDDAPMLLQTRFLRRFAELHSWEKHSILASLQHLADLMGVQDLDASPVLDVGHIGPATEHA
jgi:DNA-binding MarR family transcriptional regulator